MAKTQISVGETSKFKVHGLLQSSQMRSMHVNGDHVKNDFGQI
jgi:hypothetical protein